MRNLTRVQAVVQEGEAYIKTTTAAGVPIQLDKNGDPLVPIVADVTPSNPPCAAGWKFLLRDSAEDIGTFNCPKDFKSASGAGFGYSWDGIANNTSWSAKGVATVAYTWRSNGPATAGSPYLVGYSLAPWTSFNRLTDSAESLQSKQIDTLSFGGTGEIIFGNVLDGWQFFRAKPAYNTDFEGRPHSWSQTVEWQPLSNDLYISAPINLGSVTVELDPIVRYQYTEAVSGGSTDPIFAHGNEVSRLGPVLGWSVAPVQSDLFLPHWLQAAAFNGSYEWLHDVNSGRNYHLFRYDIYVPA